MQYDGGPYPYDRPQGLAYPPLEGFHMFYRMEYITTEEVLRKETSRGHQTVKLTSGGAEQHTPLSRFLRELVEYENSIKCGAGARHRYLLTMNILLPLDFKEKYAGELVHRILAIYRIKNETYFARIYKQRKCKWLTIYITDRTFYPYGKVVRKYYSSDVYRDPVRKCCCKADTPGAVLVRRKGELKRTYETKFSDKSRVLSLSPREIKGLLYKVRDALRAFFEEHGFGRRTFILPRVDYTGFSINRKKHAKAINSMLEEMENALNETGQKINAEIFPEQYGHLKTLIRQMQKEMAPDGTIGGTYKTAGKAFKINVSYKSRFHNVVNNIELYASRFFTALVRLAKQVCAELGIPLHGTVDEMIDDIGLSKYRDSISYRSYAWDQDRVPRDYVWTPEQRYAIAMHNYRKYMQDPQFDPETGELLDPGRPVFAEFKGCPDACLQPS